jgi:hypothetical protein
MTDTIWDELRLDVGRTEIILGRTEIMLGRKEFLQWGESSLRFSIWGENSWGELVLGRNDCNPNTLGLLRHSISLVVGIPTYILDEFGCGF